MNARGGPLVSLNTGERMPVVGAGVYQVPPGVEARRVVQEALSIGYRHIDTAQAYRNEADVGRALKESGIPREEIFLTTKLSPSNAGAALARSSLIESLRKLETDYVDLYLIHWPVHGTRAASWKTMEALAKEGLCRSIGVSNYAVRHLQELEEVADTVPAVNQVEFHPFLYQRPLLEYCTSHHIQLEAYAPLARAERISDPAIAQVARETGHTPAQVMLRWGIQHGLVVIPKSMHETRLRENFDVFDFTLDRTQVQMLDSLHEEYRTCWDPTDAP